MEWEEKNGGVFVRDIGEVNLKNIFDNGQCFRFTPYDGAYRGVAFERYITFRELDGGIFIHPCSAEDFVSLWKDFLDLDRDYSLLFPDADEILRCGMDYAPGLRILRQQPFEALISFIISANNNIKRIRGIVGRICDKYGEKRLCGIYGEYSCFPTAEALAAASVDDIFGLGAGYRAPYIISTAGSICDGFELGSLRGMDYFDAKKKLTSLMGVGPKVADCVLLFSLGHMRAFPADVWIKRVLSEYYGFTGRDRQVAEFAYEKFGEYAGIAQQYLFFRQKNMGA